MIRLLIADEYSIERDELRQLFADIKVIKDASGSQAREIFRNDGFGMVIPRVAPRWACDPILLIFMGV